MRLNSPIPTYQHGMTLIELLIVIVLLGIAIALVGPFTVQQVESAQARNEQLRLNRWLQQQSFSAFTSATSYYYVFDGKSAYVTEPDNQEFISQNDSSPIIIFDHLFFPKQWLKINHNGYMTPDTLHYSYRGKTEQIKLAQLLEVKDAK